MKRILFIVIFLAAPFLSVAQDPPLEFGEISEIANMTQVYVHCEDLKIRQKIVDELKKEPMLEIVGRVQDAEFMVSYTFRWTSLTTDRGVFGTRTKTSNYGGDLAVIIRGTAGKDDKTAQRIVWSVSKDRGGKLGKHPYDKGARAFLDDYRRARANVKTTTVGKP
jgi:hypothetical protein